MRDPVMRAVMRNEDRPHRLVIGGQTVLVDDATAAAFLRQISVSENREGRYVGTLREKPHEPAGKHIGEAIVDDRPWKAEADRDSIRHTCDICGREPKDRAHAVDHDHATGKLRGILCGPCNTALGMLRDSPDLMRRAAAYIEEPPGVRVGRFVRVAHPQRRRV